MGLIQPTASTVTIAAGASSGSFAGGDVSTFKPGMVLCPGAYYGSNGFERTLASVTPDASGIGGTFTIQSPFRDNAAFNAQAFCVDPKGGNIQAFTAIKILNYLVEFLGIGGALGGAAKQIRLARASAGLYSAMYFGIESRNWFGIEQRNVGGTETLLFRAYVDGSTPVDVMSVNGPTGALSIATAFTPKPSASGSIGNATTGRSGFQITSADAFSDAYMSFSAQGWGAVNLGLGTDGGLYVGGLTMGTTKDRILTKGSLPNIPIDSLTINGSGGLNLTTTGEASVSRTRNLGAPANYQRYDQYLSNDGTSFWRLVADDYSNAGAWMALRRSGIAPTELNPYVNINPYADGTYTIGVNGKRFYDVWSQRIHIDPNFASFISGVNPIVAYDAGDYVFYGRSEDAFYWGIGGTNRTILNASFFMPANDAGQYLGGPSNRWNTIYSNSGAINTSDAREKTPKRAFTDDELDAWGDVQSGAFQYLDAVTAKGEDHARIHYGYVAQEIHSSFAARGIDAGRLALWCADEKTRTITKTRTLTRQKAESVSSTETYIDGAGETAVRRTRVFTTERPVTRRMELYDADGRQVMQPMPDPTDTAEDPKPPLFVPVYHDEPVMETYEETYEEQQPTGESRYGLRYDGCHVIEGAYQRRRADRIEARLAALEARLAA